VPKQSQEIAMLPPVKPWRAGARKDKRRVGNTSLTGLLHGIFSMVGVSGFEPPTSWSQSKLMKRRRPLVSFRSKDSNCELRKASSLSSA